MVLVESIQGEERHAHLRVYSRQEDDEPANENAPGRDAFEQLPKPVTGEGSHDSPRGEVSGPGIAVKSWRERGAVHEDV